MITVAIVTRRLREGKTYEDFRRAWFHTVGFGARNRMFSVISAAEPRDITVIGFTDVNVDEVMDKLRIDVKERLANPLDEVIEPEIGRQFGILVAEDDFSAAGEIEYRPPMIDGEETNLDGLARDLATLNTALAQAAAERDTGRERTS